MSLFGAITNSQAKYRGLFRPRERPWSHGEAPPGLAMPSLIRDPIAPARDSADFIRLTEWTFIASSANGEEFGGGPARNIVAAYESLMDIEDDASGF